MTPSIAKPAPAMVAVADASNARFRAAGREHGQPAAGFRRAAELVEDAGLTLLALLTIPVSILVIGTPIALLVRAVLEILSRL